MLPALEFVLKYEPRTGLKSIPVFIAGINEDGSVKTSGKIDDALRMSLTIAVASKSLPLPATQAEYYRPPQIRVIYPVTEWKLGEEVTDKNIGNYQ